MSREHCLACGCANASCDSNTSGYLLSHYSNSLVVALSPSTGAPLWVSAPLDGACQGTPHISSNGKYVFVTHNSGGSTVGHFTVLAHGPDAATVLYETTDTKGPFSPPGIFYNPIEGNFATGRGNNQDVLIWSHSPSPDATNGEGGSMLAFQLPRNYVPNLSTDILDVTIVNPAVTWRSTSPPLLTAGGLQLFWPVSRGQFRSWINTRFSASSSGNIGFDRGVPSWLAPQNTPAVDNDVTPTILCAGGAALEFACMNAADITAGAIWSVDLSGIVLSNPLFSTEGDRVYFAEDRGVVFSVNPQNGDKYFEKSTGAPLFSNFCLSGDGAFLYYGDQIGNVVAWKVGEESTSPTLAPEPTLVPMPTVSPPEEQSMAPTGEMIAPISSPTSSPTTERMDSPTAPAPTAVPPTRAPVASPTKSPVTSSAAVAGAIGALLQAGVVLVLGM